MPRCAVANCKAYHRKGVRGKNGDVLSFFRFPLDATERKKWLTRCKRADYFDPEQERVCSDHFLKSDLCPFYLFQCSQGAEGKQPQPRLKDGAVPTLHLPSKHERLVIYFIALSEI